ncbi:hypothetical protein Syun_029771 [Stephania yunnanensis]|uniref:Uncharacterized protein n=1 Tax=Stephania yunnanensis TaxID=152371 RepID=A0AAP0EAP9_9MAGN
MSFKPSIRLEDTKKFSSSFNHELSHTLTFAPSPIFHRHPHSRITLAVRIPH